MDRIERQINAPIFPSQSKLIWNMWPSSLLSFFSFLSFLSFLLLETTNLLVPVPLALNVASSVVHLNAFLNFLVVGFGLASFFFGAELAHLVIFLDEFLVAIVLGDSLVLLVEDFILTSHHFSTALILQLLTISRLLQKFSLLVLQVSSDGLIDLLLSSKLLFEVLNPVTQLGLFFEVLAVLARLTTLNLSFEQLSFKF